MGAINMVLMNNTREQVITDHMGNTFDSLGQMCKYHGTTERTFNKRLKEGKTLEACLKSNVVFYQGQRYSNKRELCEAVGMKLCTLESRQRNGDSIEEALDKDLNAQCKPIAYRGVNYPSVRDLCRAYDVDTRIFYKRKQRGCDLMGCLGHVPETIFLTEPFTYRGKQYTKYEDMCHDYRTNARHFYNAFNDGWTFDQIFGFEKKPAPNGVKVELYGMKFFNKDEICMVFGVTRGQFDYARKEGCNIETCIRFDIRLMSEYQQRYNIVLTNRKNNSRRTKTPTINTQKPISYRGVVYNGIEEFAKKHGQPFKQVSGRIARGWSLDEALYGRV